MTNTPEVAIIGAGPYALSLAAHLRALGVEHRIFGMPMATWRTQMPKGMFLKSDGFTSNLYDRDGQFTLKRYCAEEGLAYADEGTPVSLDTFCAYGHAFQQRFVPQLEQQLVTRLEASDDGYVLRLDDGQTLQPRKVVLAVGITHFQHLPETLARLPSEFCSHSSACANPAQFAGRDVTIVGGGASAIDLAALLQAVGASVRLVARTATLKFLNGGPGHRQRSLWQRLRQPQSGLGPSWRSLFYAEAALLFHLLPERTRLRIARKYLGPAGGWFMRDQILGKIELLLGHSLQDAQIKDGCVRLRLLGANDTVSEIATSHVIAATGYKIDLRRLSFLDEGLLSQLRMVDHTPVLSSHFETSAPGLHVIGPAAANSFGPVMRFAFGARFCADHLSAHLARRRSFTRATIASEEIPSSIIDSAQK